jgi:hypothetical protein
MQRIAGFWEGNRSKTSSMARNFLKLILDLQFTDNTGQEVTVFQTSGPQVIMQILWKVFG